MRPFSWRATFSARRSEPSKEGSHRAREERIRDTINDVECEPDVLYQLQRYTVLGLDVIQLIRTLNGSDDGLSTLYMRATPKSKSSNLLQAFTKPLPIESQTPHIHLRFGLCLAGFMGSR